MDRLALFAQVAALRRSVGARRGLRNAAYSTGDYLVSPLLMIAAAPFLVARLDWGPYGIWMLANAVMGTMGVFSAGLGDAAVKYVSSYRATEPGSVARVVRSTLTVSVLFGGLLAAVALASAAVLVRFVFKVAVEDAVLAVRAIQLAGVGLLVRSVESVFLSTLRGYERYDLAAKVTMVVRVATIGSAVALAYLGYGIVAILAVGVTMTAAGTAVLALLSRQLVGGLSFLPLLDPKALREVLGFGMYSWIQSVGGMIFAQVDLLLIGAMLGSVDVAHYALSVQLAQPIHALPAAAFAFLFPLVSHRVQQGGHKDLKALYRRFLFANIVCAAALALPLIAFGRPILALWMGPEFASRGYQVLAILAVAYALLSINVVPHNLLLGLGQVRFVSLTNLAGGMMSLIGVAALVPVLGLQGAAVGRLLYGPAISLNYVRARRSL